VVIHTTSMRLFIFFIFLITVSARAQNSDLIYVIDDGKIDFKSEAPLEIIRASSSGLKGLINFTNETFAFQVPITTFKGFNSVLQQEHFNENYMESDKFPKATFTGRLIENLNLERDGTYKVRAKGKLSIHGVEQERIIQTTVDIKDGKLNINSVFSVPLEDHNIAIPKVVQQKIAETIFVELNATGKKR
jgi:hypothetical protein